MGQAKWKTSAKLALRVSYAVTIVMLCLLPS
jgi:hypothetical protein